jgi:hypothetical protein
MVIYKLRSAAGHPITKKSPNAYAIVEATKVPNLRCPHCMHMGAFSKVVAHDLQISHREMRERNLHNITETWTGLRSCPNPECLGLVLIGEHFIRSAMVLSNTRRKE